MNIAFDLDDLLIPTTCEFSVGSMVMRFPLNIIFKERLRVGTIGLLNELSKNHNIFIYTTSLRPRPYLYAWFRCLGIRLRGVVNYRVHSLAVLNTQYANLSKAPQLFGIDMMIDDSAGVEIECRQQGVHCIVIDKDDPRWDSNILEALQG